MSKLLPAYLLLGPEKGQKDDFIKEIRKGLSTVDSLEETRHYAFETEITSLVSDLRNGGLFSSARLVFLLAAEELKKKADLEILKDYLKNPSPEVTLVMVSEETKVDESLKKSVEKLGKDGVKIFWELFDNQKKGWLINHFRTLGLVLGQEEADFLLEMVENSTDQLKSEGEKLVSFFGPGRSLTMEDLETWISHSKEETVFTLFDRILEGSYPDTMEVLNRLLMGGDRDGAGVIPGLVWQFRNLVHLRQLLDQGLSSEEALAQAHIRGTKKSKENNLRAARKYSPRDLEQMLRLFAEYEERMRGIKSDAQSLVLELFFYQLLVKKGNVESPLEVL